MKSAASFGIVTTSDEAAGITYNALLALQHRGQEGAGIAIQRDGSILYHKDVGLVSEVFGRDVLDKLPKAHMANAALDPPPHKFPEKHPAHDHRVPERPPCHRPQREYCQRRRNPGKTG